MTEAQAEDTVLDVKNLQTVFFTNSGLFKAVDDLSFSVRRGETLAIVGESGCGKSVTALSIMRLVPDPPGRIVGGSIMLEGIDLLGLDESQMRAPRCWRWTVMSFWPVMCRSQRKNGKVGAPVKAKSTGTSPTTARTQRAKKYLNQNRKLFQKAWKNLASGKPNSPKQSRANPGSKLAIQH